MGGFIQRGLSVLVRRQTNILSAAFVIMGTVVLSQILGLIRQRLLLATFGASNILGIYNYSSQLPDAIFQLTIAAALSSAFIPVFSQYLTNNLHQQAYKVASTLLVFGLTIFAFVSILLAIGAPFFLQIFNLGGQFNSSQMTLMANLMRLMMVGELLFIIATFFTAVLQSYNRFFLPGLAAASYNLGIIIAIVFLSKPFGIFAVPLGVILGSTIYICIQLPVVKYVGFSFHPSFSQDSLQGIKKIMKLMWPNMFSILISQLGIVGLAALISYLVTPGRMHVIFDIAKTLAYAPVVLFGLTISQAALPVLSREKDKPQEFRTTLLTSFNQMLYLVLPISALILILRIPLVRLVFGASGFDWSATLLTGHVLIYLSFSIFAQALTTLLTRGFYALQDTRTPFILSTISTAVMIIMGGIFVVEFHLGLESLAVAFAAGNILDLILSMILLNKRIGGFDIRSLYIPMGKIVIATIFTGVALYIPIKLLDQLVFDTTRTINLILLSGISSLAGLMLYLFLTWLLDVKEASTFLLLFKKVGNWREILGERKEVIEGTDI